MCSASTPPPAYSIGIDQPPKSASLAPSGDVAVMEGRHPGTHGQHASAAAPQGPAGARESRGAAGPLSRIRVPPTISATDHPLEKLTGDAVVVAVGKGPDGPLPTPGAEAVDRLLGGRLLPALADLGRAGARTR